MKTAHQFARELLAGPDLPIFVVNPAAATVEEMCREPLVHEFEGAETPDGGDMHEALEIHSGTPVMGL